jgi:hypothetical protein
MTKLDITIPRTAILRTFDHLCRDCMRDLRIPMKPGFQTVMKSHCPAKAFHLKSRR